MKYTLEFKLECVERYKQTRMRLSTGRQEQEFLQSLHPALGKAGKTGRGRNFNRHRNY